MSVVGVGASAGGVKVAVPENVGATLVVIVHLDPRQKRTSGDLGSSQPDVGDPGYRKVRAEGKLHLCHSTGLGAQYN